MSVHSRKKTQSLSEDPIYLAVIVSGAISGYCTGVLAPKDVDYKLLLVAKKRLSLLHFYCTVLHVVDNQWSG
jgi:hypothetical protein